METNRRYYPETANASAVATVSAKVTATASSAAAVAAAAAVSEAIDSSIANNNVNNNYTQGDKYYTNSHMILNNFRGWVCYSYICNLNIEKLLKEEELETNYQQTRWT